MKKSTWQQIVALLIVAVLPVAAYGQLVGEPSGSFNITVKQGATIVAQDNVSIGPGGDLPDLKATFQDGDPESHTQIGLIGLVPNQTPIILKVVSEPVADTPVVYRLLHFYIDVPLSMAAIHLPGPTSLFDPNGSPNIEVSISGMTFDNGVIAQPRLENLDLFYTSFMRDYQGHFYESVGALPYDFNGNGVNDIQVPGTQYLDESGGGTQLTPYLFAATPGVSSSWAWSDIRNPGLATTVHNGFSSGQAPVQPGYVFELGVAVAFIAVPEPSTLALLSFGLLLVIRPRRR
ncbi:MAG: PEP-CTERM sorting domain-containing protein [Planctomycetota bacterium]